MIDYKWVEHHQLFNTSYMKVILFMLFIFLGFNSFAQFTIVEPEMYYFSKFRLENSNWIKVGEKILFRQECNPEIASDIPTGIVFYENAYHEKERFSMSIEFKDTVIVAVTYYLSSKQARLLKTIGYSDVKGRASAIKGQWTYILDEPTQRTVIVGDKKQIVVVQTINEKPVG